MGKDIHVRPFDESTKAKLLIFRDYLKEWLPVFISKKDIIWQTINIFDFFSGPGCDIEGFKGSPLIIIEELQAYSTLIKEKKLNVKLYFNEFDKEKYEKLKIKIQESGECSDVYSIQIDNSDFKKAFENQYSNMKNKSCANLLFLDQNGIKQIDKDVFEKIVQLKTTDFLFFVSSSTIKRFADEPSILKYINMDSQQIERTPYHKIHKLVLNYYKSLIPSHINYYLAPFSLKKNNNLYGLIFGSGHILGIEKFLKTCWEIDPIRGEANFDIDKENIVQAQLDLFTGEGQKSKKVDLFEKELEDGIMTKRLNNDKLIYMFTITNGFTPQHARKVINKLIISRKIKKISLNLSSKICKRGEIIKEIMYL